MGICSPNLIGFFFISTHQLNKKEERKMPSEETNLINNFSVVLRKGSKKDVKEEAKKSLQKRHLYY